MAPNLGNIVKEQWNSLNGRLKFCGFIAVFGIAAVTIFSLAASWRSAYKEVREYFRQAEAEMTFSLNDCLEDIQAVSRNAGYSIPVQRFLLSNNPEIVIMNYNSAVEYITDEVNSSKYCKNIYVESVRGRYLRAVRYRVGEIREGIASNAQGVKMNRPLFETRENAEGMNELYFYLPVYNILWVERDNEILCTAVYDLRGVTSLPLFAEDNRGGTVLLLYKNRIVSSSRAVPPEEQEAISAAAPGQSRVNINGRKYLAIKVSLPENLKRSSAGNAGSFWDFIYYVSEKEVTSRVFSHMNRGLIILSVVVSFITVILMVLIHSINEGVSRLVEDLNSLDYSYQLIPREPRLKELNLITRSIRFMLGRINRAVQLEQDAKEKLFAAVTAQAQAEFMSYRAQIGPHFLFNTLECMRAMAHSSKNGQLETMISSVSWMFRYSIHAKPMVNLSLELEHLSNYMRVMNIRSGGAYTLKTKISAAASERLIPSMILQPLAENSIAHGFANSARSHVIFLEASCGGGQGEPMRLRFVDNGLGIEEEEISAILGDPDGEGGTAHALRNIYRRMKICFGNDFTFSIRSRQGCYTRIEMLIPNETELAIPEIK